jgi:hypothetical protein
MKGTVSPDIRFYVGFYIIKSMLYGFKLFNVVVPEIFEI